MIMDLQEEKQMSKLLAKKGKFDEIVARKLFYKLVDAINYLHSKGISHREISHRDIKPENILCSEDGEVLKLIDFNCAKFTNEDHTHQNLEMLTVTGTHFYQAPEIIKGELYCKQVDIWSAGVTLY
jgi:serine/threonine protein kinase